MKAYRLWTCASAALALTAGAARAETAAVESDPIVVYGAGQPIPAFEYPGMASGLDRDAIERLAPSTVSDLLRDAPGVTFVGGPRRTGETPTIRGFGGENVLILVDGVPQTFTSAHDGRLFLDPALLRTAEVVRGAASSLYGSGAIGGVLAFETAGPDDFLADGERFGARLRVGGQSVNDEAFAVGSAYGRTGPLDVIASLGRRESGDIRLGSDADLPSDDEIWTGLINTGLELGRGLRLEAGWTGFRSEALEPNNGQGLGVGGAAAGSSLADVLKDIDSDQFRLGFTFAPSGSRLIDASATAWSGETSIVEDEVLSDLRLSREITSVGLRASNISRFTLGAIDAALIVGADWRRDEQTGVETNGGLTRPRNGVPNGETALFGVYVQGDLTAPRPLALPGSLRLMPGVRFDRYESTTSLDPRGNEDDATSPRLALSYAPNEALNLFVTWSQAFRAPSLNELYLDGVHFSIPLGRLGVASNRFVPNPNLRPETATSLEAGFAARGRDLFVADDELKVKLGFFRTEVDDLIARFVVGGAPIATCFRPPFAPCNAGTTESRNLRDAVLDGVELEASYTSGAWEAAFAFADIDGEEAITGAPTGLLQPPRASLGVRWIGSDQRLSLGGRIEAAGPFDKTLDPAEERPGYVTLDLLATWRPAFAPRVRIDAGVENVFDHAFERVFAGVKEPGRNARIAIAYEVAY